VPAELEAICQKAMAREPDARYLGTLEMAEDLRAYLEDRVVRAYETGAAAELRKWVVRNRALAATLAGAALVVTLGSTGASVVLAGKNRELGVAHDAASARARELQLQSYENAIAAADGALAAGDVTTARQYLERTGPEQRSWEWRWLAARADSSESTLYGHAGAVRCVASDASGTLLASYGDDEEVRLWDAAARRELRRVRVPDPGWPHVGSPSVPRRFNSRGTSFGSWPRLRTSIPGPPGATAIEILGGHPNPASRGHLKTGQS